MSDIDRHIRNIVVLREWKAVVLVATLVAAAIGFFAWVVSGRIVKDEILTGRIERISWNSGAKWRYPDVIVTVHLADGRTISIFDAQLASKDCDRGDAAKVRFRQMSNGHQMFSLVRQSCSSK